MPPCACCLWFPSLGTNWAPRYDSSRCVGSHLTRSRRLVRRCDEDRTRHNAIRGAEMISEAEREDRARRVGDLCACPSCHSHLIWSADSVHCATCAATYERRDGIPILMPADMDLLPTETRWIPPAALASHPRLNAFVNRARSRVSIPLTYKS